MVRCLYFYPAEENHLQPPPPAIPFPLKAPIYRQMPAATLCCATSFRPLAIYVYFILFFP